ncbi:aspartyl-phosphate phosphatase Spo0E family protein [Paenibacillus wulumuqiensis]|uniref:aspartyl-phosphate phosphatase Spo0E family protein n=1 Tax=Paenibacillus wulumuqiensis TaxID=1567107 RepID=UPI000619056B|nr:aspartyl-phosphate phosphatase Spo0E family protein [Paenibacillus wulumuqiensis]
MYCTEYPGPIYRGLMLSENQTVWPQQPESIRARQLLSLENEIRVLRSQMEQLFIEQQSFIADDVLEVSMMLDLKINEYMRLTNKKPSL